jgi:hypothetical protein
VHDELAVTGQRREQVLAAPAQGRDAPARGLVEAIEARLRLEAHALDAAADETGAELARDALDLGKLRHRPIMTHRRATWSRFRRPRRNCA